MQQISRVSIKSYKKGVLNLTPLMLIAPILRESNLVQSGLFSLEDCGLESVWQSGTASSTGLGLVVELLRGRERGR